MKATPFEFRLRFWIILAIYALGFTAPWDYWLHLDGSGPNTHVWGRLAIALSRLGLGISAAFNLILVLAILCALAGAWLRTWGSACLGYDVVHDRAIPTDRVVAAGPYRYMRNPLYLGSWLNTLALALLMTPSGAIFTLVALVGFHLRLILAEKAFLTAQLGEDYTAYCARVPRIAPALTPRVPAAAVHAQWRRAFLSEIYMCGSAISFAALGWQYNAHLLIQGVLVSFGASLVVRGVAMQPQTAADSHPEL